MVVTGGSPDMGNPLSTVQVYDINGPTETLPDLTVGRDQHACGYFLNSIGQLVRNYQLSIEEFFLSKGRVSFQ